MATVHLRPLLQLSSPSYFADIELYVILTAQIQARNNEITFLTCTPICGCSACAQCCVGAEQDACNCLETRQKVADKKAPFSQVGHRTKWRAAEKVCVLDFLVVRDDLRCLAAGSLLDWL